MSGIPLDSPVFYRTSARPARGTKRPRMSLIISLMRGLFFICRRMDTWNLISLAIIALVASGVAFFLRRQLFPSWQDLHRPRLASG